MCVFVVLEARQHLRSLAPVMNDDYDGQMIFGDICLTGEEKPRKTSPRKLVPTGDRTRARCVTGAHATAWPRAVDHNIRYFSNMCDDILAT